MNFQDWYNVDAEVLGGDVASFRSLGLIIALVASFALKKPPPLVALAELEIRDTTV